MRRKRLRELEGERSAGDSREQLAASWKEEIGEQQLLAAGGVVESYGFDALMQASAVPDRLQEGGVMGLAGAAGVAGRLRSEIHLRYARRTKAMLRQADVAVP